MRPGDLITRRNLLYAAAALLGLLLIFVLLVLALYGTIGASIVAKKVVPKLEAALGRKISIGKIDVNRGHALLREIVVTGAKDGEAPLAKVGSVEIQFAFWPSLRGKAELSHIVVGGLEVSLVRNADGSDNFKDIIDRLRKKKTSSGPAQQPLIDPSQVEISGARIKAHDAVRAVTLLAYDVNVRSDRERQVEVETGEVAGLTQIGPHVKFRKTRVSFNLKNPRETAALTVSNGQATLWSGMNLTGITGTTLVKAAQPGRFNLDLAGGYGDVDEKLWHARGWFDPANQSGDIELTADRFTFDKLAPVLATNPHIIDYQKTSLNVSVHLVVDPKVAAVSGNLDISGLTLFHQKIALTPVRNISASGEVELKYDRVKREAVVDSGVMSGGVRYLVHAEVDLPTQIPPTGAVPPATTPNGGPPPGTAPAAPAPPLFANGGVPGVVMTAPAPDPSVRLKPRLRVHVQIPAVPCQQMLDSIPPDFVPDLVGFRLGGTFEADVKTSIDWADLEQLTLEGFVGIKACKVLASPEPLSAKRLSKSFEHQALVGEKDGQSLWETIVIGPENPDFAPLDTVSPYVTRSFMTTEDSTFMEHHGFITREFRTALIRNLQAGAFKFGASSITMQVVKNVFLRREKTLSRKFQELFLTWYIETQLTKDRILEIYVNAIEFGPGLYGIKPAARVYFGKDPMLLTPVDAAFLSTLLPAPTKNFVQFCRGELRGSQETKVERILGYMHERGRLTDEEYTLARATPLVFATERKPLCSKGGYYEWKKRNPQERVQVTPLIDDNAVDVDEDASEADSLDGQ